jgi:hypothetical protein
VEKKAGREMEEILEKLEEMKREITEEIMELRKKNQEVKGECHGTIWPKGHNLASSFGGG